VALSEQPQFDEEYDSGAREPLTSQAAAGYVGAAYSRFPDLVASANARIPGIQSEPARRAATLHKSAREAQKRREARGK
jgi:hypothetical protein